MAESAAKLQYQRDFALTIDGQFVAGDNFLEVIDPATEEVFAVCPAAGREHLEQAVRAARLAFGDWSARSFEQRADLIKQYSVLLRERKNELGALLTREQGKPIGQSVAEFERGSAQADGMAGIEIPVEVLLEDEKRRIELNYRPLGCRRHHHPLERAGGTGAGISECGSLYRQYGGSQALAVYAVDDAQNGRTGAVGFPPGRSQCTGGG